MKNFSVKNFYELFESIVFALLIIIVLVVFFFRAVTVDGESMEPNYHNGEKLITFGFMYTPEKGDVVVVDKNTVFGKPIIKRVIATEGDTVKYEYKTGYVYINGEKTDESYVLFEGTNPYTNDVEITVKEGYVFLMGDNRNKSNDSRNNEVGQINVKNILGKAVLRIYPFNSIGVVK